MLLLGGLSWLLLVPRGRANRPTFASEVSSSKTASRTRGFDGRRAMVATEISVRDDDAPGVSEGLNRDSRASRSKGHGPGMYVPLTRRARTGDAAYGVDVDEAGISRRRLGSGGQSVVDLDGGMYGVFL